MWAQEASFSLISYSTSPFPETQPPSAGQENNNTINIKLHISYSNLFGKKCNTDCEIFVVHDSGNKCLPHLYLWTGITKITVRAWKYFTSDIVDLYIHLNWYQWLCSFTDKFILLSVSKSTFQPLGWTPALFQPVVFLSRLLKVWLL